MATKSRSATAPRFAQAYLGIVGLLLLAIGGVTIASHLGGALGGITLVFSQEAMDGDGAPGPAPTEGDGTSATPPPIPANEAVGGVQFVDIPSIVLTLAGGAIAAAGALLLDRRSRWSVPLGLAGSAVAAVVGLFPALIGIWAADFYGMSSPGEVLPFLLASVAFVAAAGACAVSVWRRRHELGPGIG